MIEEYAFQAMDEANSYRQFSNEFENNSNIYFRGTAEVNFENIKQVGFQPNER